MLGHVKLPRAELFAPSHEAPARQLAFSVPLAFASHALVLPAVASPSLTNRFGQIERSISYRYPRCPADRDPERLKVWENVQDGSKYIYLRCKLPDIK